MKTYFLPILLTAFIFCSCSESINEPNDATIEQTIEVTKNQTFSFELESHGTSGYQWDYVLSNSSILQIDSTNYRSQNEDVNGVGGSSIETFYFTALQRGQCAINLREHRPWMKDVPPLNTARYVVLIN